MIHPPGFPEWLQARGLFLKGEQIGIIEWPDAVPSWEPEMEICDG